jgi:RimJ/RimL family protein N-acetyltransferase
MIVEPKEFFIKDISYSIRSALETDAKNLSELRLQIDGETENFDREKGEDFIDEFGFKKIIRDDTNNNHNLFLVAEVNHTVVGFIRAVGNNLKRTSHRVEFGIGVSKEFWGYGIGKNLLIELIQWADQTGIRKISLHVLETNQRAIKLYESLGFKVEGILIDDKLLSDGRYYNTIIMGRINEKN